MFSLTASELGPRLRTPGGAEFVEFCNAVIVAQCWNAGIPLSEITFCSRTDIPDGRVDTRVDGVAVSDPTGFFDVPSIWQFKAVERDGLFPSAVSSEFRPSRSGAPAYIHECIQQGYAYRFCIADVLTPEKQAALKEAAWDAIRQLDQRAPEPHIIGLDSLINIANSFPAIVLKYKPEIGNLMTLGAWRNSARSVTDIFVPNSQFEDLRHRVRNHCAPNTTPPTPVLRVQGSAGVGKTRGIFEALADFPGAESLVMYTGNEQMALEAASRLANLQETHGCLIVDDCSLLTEQQIAYALIGCRKRVRCICISDGSEQIASIAPELSLTKMSTLEVEKVLEHNFPHVTPDRRRAYADLSGGFVRIAADMCAADSLIPMQGSIHPGLQSIESYFACRLSPVQRDAVEAISILGRVRHKAAQAAPAEVAALCTLTGQNEIGLRVQLNGIKDSPGFVECGALYYRVTPAVIAIVAFRSAWQKWAQPDPEDFLRRIPPELHQPFIERVRESASVEVREIVQRFFRRFADDFTSADLASPALVSKLIVLVETDPGANLARLARIVESATADQLAALAAPRHGQWGSRRQLVWLAERLARFQEYFYEAENILFHLALCEDEPRISNNATRTWQGLFQMFFSGTSLPLQSRLDLLERRIEGANARQAELIGGAFENVLEFEGVRMAGPAVIGGRIPPPDWQPATHAEQNGAIRRVVGVFQKQMESKEPTISRLATSALLAGVNNLVRHGFLDLVQPLINLDCASETLRAEMARHLKRFVRLARRSDFNYGEGYLDNVQRWIDIVEPATLRGRIFEEVGSQGSDHFEDEGTWQERLDRLASQLYGNPNLFDEMLPWLSSAEARAARPFGLSLAKADPSALLLDRVIAVSSGSGMNLGIGYLHGLVWSTNGNIDRLNAMLDDLEKIDAPKAAQLALSGGKPLRAFERALRLVEVEQIHATHLLNFTHWNGHERTTNAEAARSVSVLLRLAESGGAGAADALIDTMGARISSGQFDEWLETDHDLICNALASVRPVREAFWWAELISKLAKVEPALAVKVAAREIIEGEYDVQRAASGVLCNLCATHPDAVMQEIGRYALSETAARKFYLRKFAVFSALPFEVVKAWILENGVEAARRVARHVPAPFIDGEGRPCVPPLTEFLLREYESDDRTFREFCAGVHSLRFYVGDIAAQKEQEAMMAQAFWNHPLRRIRDWAQVEQQGFEEARQHREWLDEMGQ